MRETDVSSPVKLGKGHVVHVHAASIRIFGSDVLLMSDISHHLALKLPRTADDKSTYMGIDTATLHAGVNVAPITSIVIIYLGSPRARTPFLTLRETKCTTILPFYFPCIFPE